MNWENLTSGQQGAIIAGDCDASLYNLYISRIISATKTGNAAKSRYLILKWANDAVRLAYDYELERAKFDDDPLPLVPTFSDVCKVAQFKESFIIQEISLGAM